MSVYSLKSISLWDFIDRNYNMHEKVDLQLNFIAAELYNFGSARLYNLSELHLEDIEDEIKKHNVEAIQIVLLSKIPGVLGFHYSIDLLHTDCFCCLLEPHTHNELLKVIEKLSSELDAEDSKEVLAAFLPLNISLNFKSIFNFPVFWRKGDEKLYTSGIARFGYKLQKASLISLARNLQYLSERQ
jgi:hypothetical protein